MPKTVDRRPTERLQIKDQDTFDYTTPNIKPAAHPVRTYSDPGQPTKMTALSQLLNAVGVASDLYAQNQRETAREQAELGAVDAFLGLDAAGSSHAERIKAFESTKGEVAAGEFHTELVQYVEENKHLLPDEFDSGLRQLRDKHAMGRSPYFLTGLVKRALPIEEQARLENRKFLANSVQAETLDNVGKLMDQDLTSDPQLLNRPDIDQVLRGYLSNVQNKTKSLVERRQVTELFTNKMIALADRLGKPELLAFADVPDQSGYRVVNDDRLALKITNGIQAAEASKRRMEAASLADTKEAEKKEKDRVVNNFTTRLFNIQPGSDFRTQVSSLIGELEAQADTMDSGDYQRLRQMAYDVQQNGGFRKTPDYDKYIEAYHKAMKGELTNVGPYVQYLDVGSFNNLMQTQDRAADQLKDHRVRFSVNNQEQFMKAGIDEAVGPVDPILGKPAGYLERENTFKYYYTLELEEARFTAEQNGNYLSVSDLDKIKQSALQKTFAKHGPPQSTQANTQTTTPQSATPGKSVEERLEALKKKRSETAQ